MIVTKGDNVKAVSEFHDLAPGQVLYLAIILKNYPKVEITGFGEQSKFAPISDDNDSTNCNVTVMQVKGATQDE